MHTPEMDESEPSAFEINGLLRKKSSLLTAFLKRKVLFNSKPMFMSK